MSERTYTPEQQKVISSPTGHACVSAVAGSGKTETLVGRLRFLLKTVPAERIAVVMFNTSAAEEFRKRFETRVGGKAPQIRTFNSMGQRITNLLVSEGQLPEAKLVTTDYVRTRMAKTAFTTVFKRLNGDDASPDRELVDSFVTFIGLVKSGIESPETVFDKRRYGHSASGFPDAFALFEKDRRAKSIRFFEDQLYDPVMAMLRKPVLQTLVTNRLDHLVVDEAQDVNGVQIELVKILAGERAAVMIVGDEDQSIYAWRGAKPEFMAKTFGSYFPTAVRYTLPHTFRFGHSIALAANHLISRNTGREPKQSLSAEGTPRSRITTRVTPPDGSGVGPIVEQAIADGRSYSDVAVLVRTYDLAVPVELDLLQRKIPYFVYGRPPLLRVPEISAFLGVLMLGSGLWSTRLDETDRRAMLRNVLSMPSVYLPKATLDDLAEQAFNTPERLADLLRGAISPAMKSYQAEQLRGRSDSLRIVIEATPADMTAAALMTQYRLSTDFDRSVIRQCATAEQAESIRRNVHAFITMAERHKGTIAEFLDELDPLIDTREQAPPTTAHVWIGSIHRAKGAEWPIVVVPGLASGAFPMENLTNDLAAERRLCYVAMTRAKNHLFLLHPADEVFAKATAALGFDGEGRHESSVSRFVWDAQTTLSMGAAAAVYDPTRFIHAAVLEPEIANAYFAAHKLPAHCAYTKLEHNATPSAASTTASARDPRLHPGVRLDVVGFGPGTIVGWVDERIIKMALDNGDERMFVASMMQIRVLP